MRKEMIMAYDELMIGLTDRLPITFFSNTNSDASHAAAIDLFRYAFDHYLHWSPKEIRDYLTFDVINDLKLMPVFRYIKFPDGFIPENSLFYIAWLAYPETINARIQDVELAVYHKYLNKEIKKLPALYFTGERGIQRACNCLIDRLNYYQPFSSTDSFYVYEFFVSPGCIQFLGKSRLIKIVIGLNATPLEYYYRSLIPSQRDPVMFSFFDFLLQYKAIRDEEELNAINNNVIASDDTPLISEEDVF